MIRKTLRGASLAMALVLSIATLRAVVKVPADFQVETVVSGLNRPTAFVYARDGRLLIAEKGGRVRIVTAEGVLLPVPFATVTVDTGVDRGLLGITVHPGFPEVPYVYLAYTTNIRFPGSYNWDARVHRVTRWTANGDVGVPGSEVILVDNIPSDTATHGGGALHFGPDGNLYVMLGDGSPIGSVLALRAQDLDQPVGKVLRIGPDGTIPEDNPFYAGPNASRSRVWQYGLRNPFKAAFRPGNGTLYLNDVGWDSWEEVDGGPRGANFGWPCYEGWDSLPYYWNLGASVCAGVMHQPPLHAIHRNDNASTLTGGVFYTGSGYPAVYEGGYFLADYSRHWVKVLRFDPSDRFLGITDFAQGDVSFRPLDLILGSDDAIRILDFASDFTYPSGSVLRLAYVGGGNHAPVPRVDAHPTWGYAPLSVIFAASGSEDADGDPLSCRWDFGDGATSDVCDTNHLYDNNGRFVVLLAVSDGSLERFANATVTVGSAPPEGRIDEPQPHATYEPGDLVKFTGSAQDPDDGPLPPESLRWTILQHHNGTHQHVVLDAVGAAGVFTAQPHGDTGETIEYEVLLKATDGSGLSDTRSLLIPRNRPPVAVAPDDAAAACVYPASTIVLDGGRSSDPDEQPLRYAWAQAEGPMITLMGRDQPIAWFQAPTVPGGTTLTFRLRVDDFHVESSDSVTVAVPDLTDEDEDGDPACSDCLPRDPSAASPPAIDDLMLRDDSSTLTWSATPTSEVYQVYRGVMGGKFEYNHACLAVDVTQTSYPDPEFPPPGASFYYLARGVNACGATQLGAASNGFARPDPGCATGSESADRARPTGATG